MKARDLQIDSIYEVKHLDETLYIKIKRITKKLIKYSFLNSYTDFLHSRSFENFDVAFRIVCELAPVESSNSRYPSDISRLSDRVDEIAKNTDADVNRTLFRIIGNHIDVYEIDLSEEEVKSFLGSFKINDLQHVNTRH
ncbi:MAG: hypothetical protein M9949_14330 [Candidatus Kapabacteria bacterium]|nr:hypothetical protein [Candidatus Kapabacteria bacterium]